MTEIEYANAVQRTKTGLKININTANEDLVHAVLGMVTEVGEVTDQLKKHLFYGNPLDLVNLREELGDLSWYISVLQEWIGTTDSECKELNIEKLKIRYPEKFTSDKALNRNLEAERKCLEK